jgi:hypothetical protein
MTKYQHARIKEICPNCGSLYVIKYGKIQLKEKTLQKYRCMNCRYIWHEHIAESMSPNTFELILNMLRAFIRDIDLGKSVDDAGWIPLNEENIRCLQKISFCEVDYENMSGRVNPHSKLPEDLLLTEEGLIFSEYIKSLDIAEEVRRICNNEKEYLSAITKGLKLMFQRARYTFWEREDEKGGGYIPDKIRSLILNSQWARTSESFADWLAENLLVTVYGADKLLDTGGNSGQGESHDLHLEVFDNEVLKGQWSKIIEYLSNHKEIVEFLGLIWFSFKKIDENKIDHMGARIIILEEIIKVVASKKGMDENILRDKLKTIGEALDRLNEEELWGLNWGDVFIIPW